MSAKPQYGTTCRKAKQLETANSLALTQKNYKENNKK